MCVFNSLYLLKALIWIGNGTTGVFDHQRFSLDGVSGRLVGFNVNGSRCHVRLIHWWDSSAHLQASFWKSDRSVVL